LVLEKFGIGDYLLNRLGLTARREPEWSEWERLVSEVRRPKPTIRIALVGKYVELHDAYFSVREALEHALALGLEVQIDWLQSSDLEKDRGWDAITQTDGILVPGVLGAAGSKVKSRRSATPVRTESHTWVYAWECS
jgi:CTP synthase